MEIKIKRKLWIHPDYNIQFRNMISVIRALESLPIKHYTIKNIEYKINKFTKKQNGIQLDIKFKKKLIKITRRITRRIIVIIISSIIYNIIKNISKIYKKQYYNIIIIVLKYNKNKSNK